MSEFPSPPPTFGLVLAGGLARRMGGGDKARIKIGALDHHRPRAGDDCRANASTSSSMPMATRNASRTPAASWCRTACRISQVPWPAFWPGSTGWPNRTTASNGWLSVPGDCPFLPDDLVERLHQARREKGTPLACARSGEWRHPVVGLWPLALRENLRQALRGRRPAQDRGLDRASRRRHCRLAGSAGRSLLQRQHAGRRRTRRPALRCSKAEPAATRPQPKANLNLLESQPYLL